MLYATMHILHTRSFLRAELAEPLRLSLRHCRRVVLGELAPLMKATCHQLSLLIAGCDGRQPLCSLPCSE